MHLIDRKSLFKAELNEKSSLHSIEMDLTLVNYKLGMLVWKKVKTIGIITIYKFTKGHTCTRRGKLVVTIGEKDYWQPHMTIDTQALKEEHGLDMWMISDWFDSASIAIYETTDHYVELCSDNEDK